LGLKLGLGLQLGIGLGLAFFKDLCDNNAHHKLEYNIRNMYDGGACNYKNCQRLPMTVYSRGVSGNGFTQVQVLSRPEELVG